MATYAFPPNSSIGLEYSPVGHGHVRPHRKIMPERIPLDPATSHGAYLIGGKSPSKTSANTDVYSHQPSRSMPVNTMQDARQVNQHHFRNNSTFPSLEVRGTMDKRHGKPVAPLNLKSSNYAFPAASTHSVEQRMRSDSGASDASRQAPTISEVLTSILLPLPYICFSILQYSHTPLDQNNSVEPTATTSAIYPPQLSVSNLFVVGIATSLSLLSVGSYGKFKGSSSSQDQAKSSLGHGRQKQETALFSSSNTRRIGNRILQIALPFFATTQLGGARVGQVILVATVGELLNCYNVNSSTKAPIGFRERLRHAVSSRKWTVAALSLQALADAASFTSSVGSIQSLLGHLTLGFAVFAYPPPYSGTPIEKAIGPSAEASPRDKALMASRYRSASTTTITSRFPSKLPSLFPTIEDVNTTLLAGGASAGITVLLYLLSHKSLLSATDLTWISVSSVLASLCLILLDPRSMISRRKIGLALGLSLALFLQQFIQASSLFSFVCEGVVLGCIWLGCNYDTPVLSDYFRKSNSHNHQHHKEGHVSHDHAGPHSTFTEWLLQNSEDWPLLHSILIEKDSRRILYFMCLNFGFMLVQTFYAIVTGSLGLLSDSIHMLFDCLALVVGLCAAVMSKWPPSVRFPHGFGKMDTLAGFANGVFLMLISVEIIYEAIERLVEGSQMQRLGELLTVSTLGLAVNLVGMTAFGHAHHGHGHDHGHGHNHDHDHDHDHDHNHDHNHSHSHEKSHGHSHAHTHPLAQEQHIHSDGSPFRGHHHQHFQENTPPSVHTHSQPPTAVRSMSLDQGTLPFSMPSTPMFTAETHRSPSAHLHSHDPPKPATHHHHHHGNENMHGIFLHVLADTLGSVAVVISSLLIQYTGWSGFDPLASCLIAILIFASAVPLVTSSARILLLTVPERTEFDLREALAGVGALRGVVAVKVPRFWMGDGDGDVKGVMHVIVGRGTELDDVRERACRYLNERNMDVLVQVEREGEGRCWCGSGVGSAKKAVSKTSDW